MITEEAYKLMWEAWQKEGLKPYTYTADDGYGSQHSEVMVQVTYV